jgi:tetratricopeptide (TPR) repeat protein
MTPSRSKRNASKAKAGGATSPAPEAAPATPRWVWFIPPVLAVLLYAVTLRNGFVLDDQILILKDPRMASLANFFHLRSGELVVRYWSLLLDHAIWGTNPLGYHLTNLLLHAATGLALFAWLRALLGRTGGRGAAEAPARAGRKRRRPAKAPLGLTWTDWAALGGSVLFVVHPMQTEAVAGVTHRKELLAALFVILALWRSLGRTAEGDADASGRTLLRSFEVGVWFALAVFAKAPAVVFFPLVLLQDLWVRRRSLGTWLLRDLPFYLPAALALVGYVVYRWAGIATAVEGHAIHFEAFNPQAAGLTTVERLMTALEVLWLYWKLLLVTPFHPTLERFIEPVRDAGNPLPWVMLLLALGFLAAAFRSGRRRPVLSLALVWLVVTPLPTLNLLPLNFLFSERYLYLPAAGVALLIAAALRMAPEVLDHARGITGAAVALFVLGMAPLTVMRASEWKNVDTLLAATVARNPGSPRILLFHGMDLRKQGRIQESLAQAQKAIRIEPNVPDPWHLAGRDYADLGRRAEALDAYFRAVRLSGHPKPSWLNDLGVALIQAGRRDEALPYLKKAAEEAPDNERFVDNYIQLLLIRPESREEGMQALVAETRTRPKRLTPWILLVESRLAAGDTTAARDAVERARAGSGRPELVRFLAARLSEASGEADTAARDYRGLLARPGLDPELKGRVEDALRRVQSKKK